MSQTLKRMLALISPTLVVVGIVFGLTSPRLPMWDLHFIAASWVFSFFFCSFSAGIMLTVRFIRFLAGFCPTYTSTLANANRPEEQLVTSRVLAVISFPFDLGRIAFFSMLPIVGWYYVTRLVQNLPEDWPWRDRELRYNFFAVVFALTFGGVYLIAMFGQPMELHERKENGTRKVGFMARTGQWTILPRFDDIRPFATLAFLTPFRQGEAWGYLDRRGRIAMDPAFPGIAWWDQGDWDESDWNFFHNFIPQWRQLLPFKKGEKWGFVHSNGRWVIPPLYDEVRPFSGEEYNPHGQWAAFRRGTHWGFLDLSGREVVSPTFEQAFSFISMPSLRSQKLPPRAIVRHNGSWAYFSIPASFTAIPDKIFSNPVQAGHGAAIGYIEDSGTFVIAPEFHKASAFHNGFALVKMFRYEFDEDGNAVNDFCHALIDRSGQTVAIKNRSAVRWMSVPRGVASPGQPLHEIKVGVFKCFLFSYGERIGLMDPEEGVKVPPEFDHLEMVGSNLWGGRDGRHFELNPEDGSILREGNLSGFTAEKVK